jgi:hypothetical protein
LKKVNDPKETLSLYKKNSSSLKSFLVEHGTINDINKQACNIEDRPPEV